MAAKPSILNVTVVVCCAIVCVAIVAAWTQDPGLALSAAAAIGSLVVAILYGVR